MGRRKRPAFTRHGMMRAVALSLALLLAACGGHSNVQFASSALPSGGVSTGGSVQAQSQSTLAVLIAIGVLMGASFASDREMPPSVAAPELDPARRVLVQDCSKPIEDRSANLRCK